MKLIYKILPFTTISGLSVGVFLDGYYTGINKSHENAVIGCLVLGIGWPIILPIMFTELLGEKIGKYMKD